MGKIKKYGMIMIYSLLLTLLIQVSRVDAAELLNTNSKGNQVYRLQEQLIKMGYLQTSPTGYYGSATEDAIKKFQQDTKLSQDGKVGARTYEQMINVEQMAHIVYGEARGEDYTGKVAVASVILNRLESPEFPKTISDIIYQKNAFSCINDGQINFTPNSLAYQAVIDAFKGWDPTLGSVYYYNPSTATNKWIFTRHTVIQIDNHIFAR
ncbi:cell wall hydrolase [Priestia megaterium]